MAGFYVFMGLSLASGFGALALVLGRPVLAAFYFGACVTSFVSLWVSLALSAFGLL